MSGGLFQRREPGAQEQGSYLVNTKQKPTQVGEVFLNLIYDKF